ncbi:hypothetical protein [Nocardioides bruguierae]|uniref:hypothetical protein n=1 Tax=Nocardioides bruguierae TaxID=2945102 RepID=UPI0020211AAD|nr:hypothetical protein [Nocardioides bruguierae]MCL8024109.1 hypothetical protein [Nocardioides bruguierae]
MSLRRNLALVTGAVALTTTLSSCGFDLATDQVYTPAAGTNDRETEVNVLSAVVVAAQDDAGTFVGGLANTAADELSLTGLSAADTSVTVADFDPIDVAPDGYTGVGTTEDGIGLTGSFAAGDVLELTFTFDNGESATMDVPVVPACREFEGFDTASTTATGETYDCEAEEPVVTYGEH